MMPAQLFVGAGHIERVIDRPEALLAQYRQDTGCSYLDYELRTSAHSVIPEDLAVTLLVNARVGPRAFLSLQHFGTTLKLDQLPQKPLEETSQEERRRIAQLIATMARWPGLAASVATKVLHKKRPDLIPILDNQAIFGAYMNEKWPQQRAHSESVKSEDWIFYALDWIAFDITRHENAPAWSVLQSIEPTRARIQLFDSVWWMYFRLKQPIAKKTLKSLLEDESSRM